MKLIPTAIPDVVEIQPVVFDDERGWFLESFNERAFREGLRALGQPAPPVFVQDNHSCSHRGVLRGLHYQLPPHAQGKLVRVVKGSVFDVAVDLRGDSPTFGQHVTAELSADNRKMLWIPVGFAHGFLSLQDDTHMIYKVTDYYARDCETAIRWDDPDLGIAWPDVGGVRLGDKDAKAGGFSAAPQF
jgi:dTDP-4-dehydrorhamnose 3,5-epimerase